MHEVDLICNRGRGSTTQRLASPRHRFPRSVVLALRNHPPVSPDVLVSRSDLPFRPPPRTRTPRARRLLLLFPIGVDSLPHRLSVSLPWPKDLQHFAPGLPACSMHSLSLWLRLCGCRLRFGTTKELIELIQHSPVPHILLVTKILNWVYGVAGWCTKDVSTARLLRQSAWRFNLTHYCFCRYF